MNFQFFQIIKTEVEKTLGKADRFSLSRYKSAKEIYFKKKRVFRIISDIVFMLLGVFSAGFGLKGFLLPNGFIDGGVTGISLLVHLESDLPLAALILLINLPFVFIGWTQISRMFVLKTILAISFLAFVVAFVDYPVVTSDKLLVAAFGGFFLGAGIGLTIRGGAVIDGTEILAIFLNRKSILSVGDFILIFNVIIFSVAAYLLSVEVALYSILIYLAASKTVDFILEGIEEYTGVTIISPHNKEIADVIRKKLGWGLTIYSGKKGYGKSGENYPTDIIFIVVTRLDISRLNAEVERIDPNAFVVMQSIKDTRGGIVKKRPLK